MEHDHDQLSSSPDTTPGVHLESDNSDSPNDTPAPKRRKVVDETSDDNEKMMRGFHLQKVLSKNPRNKSICVEGSYNGKSVVMMMERTPLNADSAKQLSHPETKFEHILNNGIYRTAKVFLPPPCNAIKATSIYPATSKHLEKYKNQSQVYWLESADEYASITLPYIESSGFSLQWVKNILEKKSEAERIIFEDHDPLYGFVLLPDMKWDGAQVEDLYLVAIVNNRELRSIRDLRQEHLTLLQNIRDNGSLAIENKYDIPKERLRIYAHYLPSYYHFHVHFTHLDYDCHGQKTGKAHLIDELINNIQLDGEYYEKSCLGIIINEESDLSKLFQQSRKMKK